MKAIEVVAYNVEVCNSWDDAKAEDRIARVGYLCPSDTDPKGTIEAITDSTVKMLSVLGTSVHVAFGLRDEDGAVLDISTTLEQLHRARDARHQFEASRREATAHIDLDETIAQTAPRML